MWARAIVGAVFSLAGAVWVAQGTDLLHGSGMSGEGRWTVIGAVCLVLGLAFLAWAWRIRRSRLATAA